MSDFFFHGTILDGLFIPTLSKYLLLDLVPNFFIIKVYVRQKSCQHFMRIPQSGVLYTFLKLILKDKFAEKLDQRKHSSLKKSMSDFLLWHSK